MHKCLRNDMQVLVLVMHSACLQECRGSSQTQSRSTYVELGGNMLLA